MTVMWFHEIVEKVHDIPPLCACFWTFIRLGECYGRLEQSSHSGFLSLLRGTYTCKLGSNIAYISSCIYYWHIHHFCNLFDSGWKENYLYLFGNTMKWPFSAMWALLLPIPRERKNNIRMECNALESKMWCPGIWSKYGISWGRAVYW